MYQLVDGKDKHVFGRFTTGTLVNPKEHASFIIMEGGVGHKPQDARRRSKKVLSFFAVVSSVV
jgi:hypothetical protein